MGILVHLPIRCTHGILESFARKGVAGVHAAVLCSHHDKLVQQAAVLVPLTCLTASRA